MPQYDDVLCIDAPQHLMFGFAAFGDNACDRDRTGLGSLAGQLFCAGWGR